MDKTEILKSKDDDVAEKVNELRFKILSDKIKELDKRVFRLQKLLNCV